MRADLITYKNGHIVTVTPRDENYKELCELAEEFEEYEDDEHVPDLFDLLGYGDKPRRIEEYEGPPPYGC